MPKTDYERVAEPRPNMAEIDRILDYIIDHPDEWDQNTWTNTDPVCGTTYCFAGHAVVSAGYKIMDRGAVIYRPDGSIGVSVGTEAQEVLGLTRWEADELFLRSMRPLKSDSLELVKIQVEKIRARAKLQDEAFNRLAQEFIDAAGLDTIDLEHCPDSPQISQGFRGGEKS